MQKITCPSLSTFLASFVAVVPDFPKQGVMFRDVSPMLVSPVVRRMIAQHYEKKWSGKIDVVIGLDARGFLFGMIAAEALGVPFVMCRKKGKLPGKTHRVMYDLEYGSAELEISTGAELEGKRVLVIDDLLATGGTARAVSELSKKAGASWLGFSCIIEIPECAGQDTVRPYYDEVESLLIHKL